MHQDSDLGAQKLAASIELRLAEFSSEDQTKEDLKAQLQRLLNESSILTPDALQPA
jgi:hypothetical protein